MFRSVRPFLDAVKLVCGRRPAGRKPLEVSLVGRLNEGGAILAGDLDDVAEAPVGDECHRCSPTFEERVGGDRGAVAQ